jgi:hypothetical protein
MPWTRMDKRNCVPLHRPRSHHRIPNRHLLRTLLCGESRHSFRGVPSALPWQPRQLAFGAGRRDRRRARSHRDANKTSDGRPHEPRPHPAIDRTANDLVHPPGPHCCSMSWLRHAERQVVHYLRFLPRTFAGDGVKVVIGTPNPVSKVLLNAPAPQILSLRTDLATGPALSECCAAMQDQRHRRDTARVAIIMPLSALPVLRLEYPFTPGSAPLGTERLFVERPTVPKAENVRSRGDPEC